MRKGKDCLASIRKTCFRKDVYEPAEDSFLLADVIVGDMDTWTCPPRICLEIGSGSGYVVCSVAKGVSAIHMCQCFATDINGSACTATQETIRNHEMGGFVDSILCDLALPLESRMRNSVDLVVFNPPYVVTPDDEVQGAGISAAWAGGRRGRMVIDRVLPLLPLLLSPGGLVYMIAIHDNDPADIINILSKFDIRASIVARQSADEELLYVIKGEKGSMNDYNVNQKE